MFLSCLDANWSSTYQQAVTTKPHSIVWGHMYYIAAYQAGSWTSWLLRYNTWKLNSLFVFVDGINSILVLKMYMFLSASVSLLANRNIVSTLKLISCYVYNYVEISFEITVQWSHGLDSEFLVFHLPAMSMFQKLKAFDNTPWMCNSHATSIYVAINFFWYYYSKFID